MPRVHINIGSNLGDRHENLRRAVASLRQLASSSYANSGMYVPSIMSDESDESDESDASVRSDESDKIDFRVSSIVETDPWGFESENRFLNVGVSFNTDLAAPTLLERLLMTQNTLSDAPHRGVSGGYIDRLIDIDLIFYDDLSISTPELSLPHPHLAERLFVLRPLAEIDPSWTHPILHLTPTQLIDCLQHSHDICGPKSQI